MKRKLTNKDKARIKAEYEAGTSQRELSKRYDASLGAINAICKEADRAGAQEIINQGVSLNLALAGKDRYQQDAINEAIDERTRNLLFFNSSAIRNQLKADELLDEAQTMDEIETHSKITARNKEAVCGKTIRTVTTQDTNERQTIPQIIIMQDD